MCSRFPFTLFLSFCYWLQSEFSEQSEHYHGYPYAEQTHFGRERLWIYNKLYHCPLEKNFVIAWAIWNFKNKVVFNRWDVKPAYILSWQSIALMKWGITLCQVCLVRALMQVLLRRKKWSLKWTGIRLPLVASNQRRCINEIL